LRNLNVLKSFHDFPPSIAVIKNVKFRNRYVNCLNSVWVPTNEEHDWIPIESRWVSWAHVSKTNKVEESIEDMIVVHRISTEKKICIPHSVKPHLLEPIAQQSVQ
jgi:hypothetical protein